MVDIGSSEVQHALYSNQAFRFFARERIISQQRYMQFNQNNYFGMPSTDLSFTFTVMDYFTHNKNKA